MTQKEKRQEQAELEQAVKTMCAAIRHVAQKKARQYELDFLHQVRAMLDREIETAEQVNDFAATHLAREVEEAMKD